jgi:hypothetical protein
MVGEELADMGAKFVVGSDIIAGAAEATERDRPGVYADYHILDMTRLGERERRELAACRFNCLTCVAALGFGDIPPEAFATAYNLVESGGYIVFNIKARFLEEGDETGFCCLVRSLIGEKVLKVGKMQRYQHRIGTDRRPIHYVAVVGVKQQDIPDRLLDGQPESEVSTQRSGHVAHDGRHATAASGKAALHAGKGGA